MLYIYTRVEKVLHGFPNIISAGWAQLILPWPDTRVRVSNNNDFSETLQPDHEIIGQYIDITRIGFCFQYLSRSCNYVAVVHFSI